MRKLAEISPADAPSLLELWNRSAAFDRLNERLLHEKIWEDSEFENSLALVLKEQQSPVAMAMGVVRQLANQRRGYVKLLAVAPAQQRQGLASQLVLKLQTAMRAANVADIRVGESAPNYLVPGVDTRYESASRFFESLGYHSIGEARNLVAPLLNQDFSTAPQEQDLQARGFAIRRATGDDAQSLEEFLAEFWPAWQAEVAVALANSPNSVHIATNGRQVVGFAAYDSNNLGTGWFGPMGTHPDYRGQGIGKVLLRRCLKDIQQQGHAAAIIPWVSGTSLYPSQVGATVDRTFTRYELGTF